MVAHDDESLRRSSPAVAPTNGALCVGWVVGATVLFLLTVAAPLPGQRFPVDTASLGDGPTSRMRMLWEKTIFKVDVLTLEIRFGKAATRRLAGLIEGRRPSRALADSIAAVALHADDAWARIHFERDVSLSQFLDGVRENAAAARDAGVITELQLREISRGLPQWYAFLEETGIEEGDEMFYRIRGDTLRTIYRTRDGETRLDQTDVGDFRRLSVMGGYFAPGSDFRKKLVASLFDE